MFPAPWNAWLERWLPALHSVIAQRTEGLYAPGITLAIGAGYAAVALMIAGTLITRRDP